jgi:LysR family cyn operon transcriptional activator
MIIQSVGLGRLVTVLPTTIACTHSGLYAVPMRPELPNHTIALICSKGAYKSPACRAFGTLASEWNFGRCPVTLKSDAQPCVRPEARKREKINFVTDEL